MSSQNRFLKVITWPFITHIFEPEINPKKRQIRKLKINFFPTQEKYGFFVGVINLHKTALVKNHSIFRRVWTMLFFIKKLYGFFLCFRWKMIYRNAPLIFLVVCGFILFIFYTAEDQSPTAIASPLQSQKFLQLPPKLMTQGK